MNRRALLALLLCSCGDNDVVTEPVPDLVPAIDMNPDPNIVEVTLVATAATVEYEPGRRAHVLAYRDGNRGAAVVPGPMIVANQGDRLIVHFRNELDRESSIHWHGVRLPHAMDGVDAIAAGGSFDYDFVLRDAGWFWYHPHVETDEQVDLGLQGTLLVRGRNEPAIARERMFVLDDIELDDRGDVVIEPSADDLMHGRRGETLLVNGKPPGFVVASPSSVERWRIVNTSNGRFFQLRAGLPMRVIGWDGGLIPEPYDVDELVVAPGERYDIVVALDESEHRLETREGELVRIRLDGPPVARDAIPASGPPLARLPITAQTTSRRFALSEGTAGAAFLINGQRWPLNTPVDVQLGDLEIIEVVNDTDGDHPMHIHGFFVELLDQPQLGKKDTFVVGPRSTVRAALVYDEPGMWMLHCQIPEHAERGMTADIDVQP